MEKGRTCAHDTELGGAPELVNGKEEVKLVEREASDDDKSDILEPSVDCWAEGELPLEDCAGDVSPPECDMAR
jgi:hypothetical protein